jgi:hypothetical protein
VSRPCFTITGHHQLPQDIIGAQFYYMDKFMLIGHGRSLSLYKYNLDTTGQSLG